MIWCTLRFLLEVKLVNSQLGLDGNGVLSNILTALSSNQRPITVFSSITSQLKLGLTAFAKAIVLLTSGPVQICNGLLGRTVFLVLKRGMTKLTLTLLCLKFRMSKRNQSSQS